MRLLLKSKPYHRVHARSTGVNQCLCVCVYVSVCQQKQQVAKVFTDFILNPNKQYLITQVKVVLIHYMYIFSTTSYYLLVFGSTLFKLRVTSPILTRQSGCVCMCHASSVEAPQMPRGVSIVWMHYDIQYTNHGPSGWNTKLVSRTLYPWPHATHMPTTTTCLRTWKQICNKQGRSCDSDRFSLEFLCHALSICTSNGSKCCCSLEANFEPYLQVVRLLGQETVAESVITWLPNL